MESSMAKGQMRSNREIKKPKKTAAEKTKAAASSGFTSQANKNFGAGKKYDRRPPRRRPAPIAAPQLAIMARGAASPHKGIDRQYCR